ncbi:hypothetical protein FACS1894127_0670 [Clostridia bacterium]|nr:hypothetical protein FACS1894127_0670 [Clostridia bacterium]
MYYIGAKDAAEKGGLSPRQVLRILNELYAEIEDDITTPDTISGGKLSDFKYQLDAIRGGIDCINKNNGVIIAYVVGLGKSIIASAIARNIDRRMNLKN